jgi:hypothetical protein
MRGFWFRTWFLVLALVVQTTAGGASVAGSMAPMDGAAVSQHCVNHSGDPGNPSGEHKHDCLSCPFCAASVLTAFAFAAIAHVLGERAAVTLGPPPQSLAPSSPSSARAHQPRAPPAFA